jgi:predicted GIY-YIG superfamily endonuclease
MSYDNNNDNINNDDDNDDSLEERIDSIVKDIENEIEIEEKWYCYILRNQHKPDLNRTYNGKTNDLIRRLKEHNRIGAQTKGAVYTRKWGNKSWEFIAVMGYLPSDVEAQRHEWRIKKPEGKNRNRKYVGPSGRIKGLNYALGLERFTSKCENAVKDMDLTIWVLKEYAHILEDRPELKRLQIIECDELNNEYIENNIMI